MHKLKPLRWIVLGLSISSGAWATPPANNVYENGVTLTITTKPFDPKTHIVQKCGEKVCGIDGKSLYGTYGLMPKQEVTSLVLETKDWKVALDVSAMYNPNVNNSNIKKYIQVTPWYNGSYRITGYFSHDDGNDDTYICLWLVTRGDSIRNYMGDYGALASLTKRVQRDFNLKPDFPYR